jgi:hypothetical protein
VQTTVPGFTGPFLRASGAAAVAGGGSAKEAPSAIGARGGSATISVSVFVYLSWCVLDRVTCCGQIGLASSLLIFSHNIAHDWC